jgi:hypothetical protein
MLEEVELVGDFNYLLKVNNSYSRHLRTHTATTHSFAMPTNRVVIFLNSLWLIDQCLDSQQESLGKSAKETLMWTQKNLLWS